MRRRPTGGLMLTYAMARHLKAVHGADGCEILALDFIFTTKPLSVETWEGAPHRPGAPRHLGTPPPPLPPPLPSPIRPLRDPCTARRDDQLPARACRARARRTERARVRAGRCGPARYRAHDLRQRSPRRVSRRASPPRPTSAAPPRAPPGRHASSRRGRAPTARRFSAHLVWLQAVGAQGGHVPRLLGRALRPVYDDRARRAAGPPHGARPRRQARGLGATLRLRPRGAVPHSARQARRRAAPRRPAVLRRVVQLFRRRRLRRAAARRRAALSARAHAGPMARRGGGVRAGGSGRRSVGVRAHALLHADLAVRRQGAVRLPSAGTDAAVGARSSCRAAHLPSLGWPSRHDRSPARRRRRHPARVARCPSPHA